MLASEDSSVDFSPPAQPSFGEPTIPAFSGASFLNREKGGGRTGGDALVNLSRGSECRSTSSPLTRLLLRSFLFSMVMLASGRFSVILLSIIFSAAGFYCSSLASSRFLLERYFCRLLLCLVGSCCQGCFALTLRSDVLS